VAAPPAVSVAEFPAHIDVGLETAVTVGLGSTIKFIVFVLMQPAALVPVTVYIVVTVGETLTDAPEIAPGFHVYVKAPEAVKVDEEPLQIPVGEAVAIIVGVGVTDT
jgi:hypothetical protein